MAPITSHMRTKDSSPISIRWYATIATIFENDNENASSQTSFELLPTIKGNNLKLSQGVETSKCPRKSKPMNLTMC
jgi:hypothetical protein